MNGFCEIEINGKKIGLKFGMAAAEQLSQMKTMPGSNIASSAKLIWAGILNHSLIKEIEPPVTFEEVMDFVDEITIESDPNNILKKVIDAYLSSKQIQRLLEKNKEKEVEIINQDEEVKKNTGTTSEVLHLAS